MGVVVVIGAQWGDEGKGKVVDLLAESAEVVVRYAGGPNAGHTLIVGDDKLVFRLVPSGVLHAHTQCLLGQGMVINPSVLIEELDMLVGRGLEVAGRLHLSEQAHLLLPYHILVDTLREASQRGTKIGTTKRGIGPCYEDKVGRRGVRALDLRHPEMLRLRVAEAVETWAPTIRELAGELPDVEKICADLDALAPRLTPLLADVSARVDEAVSQGRRLLLEGAQGTMLDIDHGTYPFVTSSSAIAGGACTGLGVGPSRLSRVLGVTKAYTTRVGAGPFPTELDDALGEHLRKVGGEFGSVTGRPRRTGWLDLAALRYARRVNGVDAWALTKLDVLSGLEQIKLCVGYETTEGRTDTLPVTRMAEATPIYESLPGWPEDISGCRAIAELPENARAYIRFIEERSGVPVDIVSVGPRRGETIVVRDTFA